MPNSESEEYFPLAGDHPSVGGVTILMMVGDHPWQLSIGLSFVNKVSVQNSESVVYFLLVGYHPWAGG